MNITAKKISVFLLFSMAFSFSNMSYAYKWSKKYRTSYVQHCVEGANKRMQAALQNKNLDKKMKARILRLQSTYKPLCTCVMNELMKKWTPTDIENNGNEYMSYVRKVASPNGACDVRKFIKH